MWPTFISVGSTFGICITTYLWSKALAGICAFQCWLLAPARSALNSCSYAALSRGYLILILFKELSSSHSVNMVGHVALGDWLTYLIPSPSLHGREGSCFVSLVPPDDMVNSKSLVGIKGPCDSSVVIGYQVNECTHTCLAEHFC